MRWIKLEPIIQNEVSQKEKHQYRHFFKLEKQSWGEIQIR